MRDLNRVPHKEKLISGIGGTIGIFITFGLTGYLENWAEARLLLIASMGATAVLLFAAPHGPLSKPWNVIGGHIISAMIGITVFKLNPDPVTGGALAAGLAIAAMHYLDCLHPPGGATAVIPFVGGAAVAGYGYAFVLFPVGLGAVIMVLVAIAYNYPFSWRRYPQGLMKGWDWADRARGIKPDQVIQKTGPALYPDITHADLVAALSEIDTYVDVSEEDLLTIYAIATGRHAKSSQGRLP